MIGRIVKKSLYAKKPSHLILHVTNRCNLRCRTCFVDFEKYKGSEITLGEIKSLAGYLDSLIWIDISGGEPFLRKDLPEICSLFNTKSISIPTNGFDSETICSSAKKIVANTDAEVSVAVSVDGPEEIHDEIRCKGSYSKAIETVKALRKIEGLRVKVNTVLCEKNYDSLIEFMNYIRTLDVDFHSIIFLRGKPRDSGFRLPSRRKLMAIREGVFEIWKSYDYGLSPFKFRALRNYQRRMYDASLEVIRQNRQVPRCLAYSQHLVVYPDGDVSFCEMLKPIGNIRKTPIQDILKSQEAQKVRQMIRLGKCSCHHNCNMLDNHFLNWRIYPRLVR